MHWFQLQWLGHTCGLGVFEKMAHKGICFCRKGVLFDGIPLRLIVLPSRGVILWISLNVTTYWTGDQGDGWYIAQIFDITPKQFPPQGFLLSETSSKISSGRGTFGWKHCDGLASILSNIAILTTIRRCQWIKDVNCRLLYRSPQRRKGLCWR